MEGRGRGRVRGRGRGAGRAQAAGREFDADPPGGQHLLPAPPDILPALETEVGIVLHGLDFTPDMIVHIVEQEGL
jgi:hypothetical protein